MTASTVGTIEDYLALPYRIELIPSSEGGFVVTMPELPGCISQGETVEEALEMIHDAQFGWLTVALEIGRDIPTPDQGIENEYSGRFNVRVPKTIHRDLARAAADEGVSLNLFVATALARAVGHKEVAARKRGRPGKVAAN